MLTFLNFYKELNAISDSIEIEKVLGRYKFDVDLDSI
jgi:hypothetical protein